MYPCPGNWSVTGRAVVYHARTAHTLRAGIKCQHCMCMSIDCNQVAKSYKQSMRKSKLYEIKKLEQKKVHSRRPSVKHEHV